ETHKHKRGAGQIPRLDETVFVISLVAAWENSLQRDDVVQHQVRLAILVWLRAAGRLNHLRINGRAGRQVVDLRAAVRAGKCVVWRGLSAASAGADEMAMRGHLRRDQCDAVGTGHFSKIVVLQARPLTRAEGGAPSQVR